MAFVLASAMLLGYEAQRTPHVYGDAWEYWYQTESFCRHASPELWPEDKQAVNDECRRLGFAEAAPEEPYAYATASDGRLYGVHFWAYALSAVPAKICLRVFGESELADLQLANAGWFILAIGIALFGSSAPVGQRLALVGLAAVGPVIWYLKWTGAEVFSWALALIAVVMYRDRRYGWAGVAAGLAATQNPPLVFLGVIAVLAAAWERRWFSACAAIAGTALALVPFAFFQYHFGKPNLIAAQYATVNNISWVRTWGLLTDLNQGLLPYVPLLALGAVIGTIRLAYLRNVHGLLLVAGGVAIALGTQLTHNWNSDCIGLQRYLVWMIPVAAGVAVEGIGGRWRLWVFVAVAVLVHVLLMAAYYCADGPEGWYLNETPAAKWVLTRYPRLYWAEPEVFIERQHHRDGWPESPFPLPLGFAREDGTVTKLILGADCIDRLGEWYDVDPDYLATLREWASHERGLFYVHPPEGAVRLRDSVDH